MVAKLFGAPECDAVNKHSEYKKLGDCNNCLGSELNPFHAETFFISHQLPKLTFFLLSKILLTHSTFKPMTTLLRNKRRFYIRPRSTWRNELRNLYGNFLSYHFRLSTQGSHLIYLPGPRGWIVDSFFSIGKVRQSV